jgi:hypothetical protein
MYATLIRRYCAYDPLMRPSQWYQPNDDFEKMIRSFLCIPLNVSECPLKEGQCDTRYRNIFNRLHPYYHMIMLDDDDDD